MTFEAKVVALLAILAGIIFFYVPEIERAIYKWRIK